MNMPDMRENCITVRSTTVKDLSFVISAERHADNAPYIGQWSQAKHEAAIASKDVAHFILERGSDPNVNANPKGSHEPDAHPIGYLILTGLIDPHLAIHMKRIVVTEKRKGYGRQVLRWVKAYTFETLGFHRLWFDVIASNDRAKSLYLSEGFIIEGTLRDGWKVENGYEDMFLLSMLRPEYEGPYAAPNTSANSAC